MADYKPEVSRKLETLYQEALSAYMSGDMSTNLSSDIKKYVEILTEHAEQSKAANTVIITLLVYKMVVPTQDIRRHQAKMLDGFSGRSIDTDCVTPFMKAKDFHAMSSTGWLTRSFETPFPYLLDYKANIKPPAVKEAFLQILYNVEEKGVSPKAVVLYLFKLLIKERDSRNIDLVKPKDFSIAKIIQVLDKHFNYKYAGQGQGASRLPVIAIYAAYECMADEISRYQDKKLLPLASHNSSDTKSKRIGDIDVWNAQETAAYEGVEIKFNIQITPDMIVTAYEKFKIHQTNRYYLLTTANMDSADWDAIDAEVNRIHDIHGCQVIVNGVYSSLKYYLRLLNDPSEFIDRYVELLKKDKDIKYSQKVAWNDVIQSSR